MFVFKQAIQGMQEVFRQKSFFVIAAISASIMGYTYYWLLIQVTSIPSFFRMAQNGDFGPYGIPYAAVYWLVTLATVVFFGISVALLVWLWQHSQWRKNFGSGTSNTLGAIVGAFGSACPVCGAFFTDLGWSFKRRVCPSIERVRIKVCQPGADHGFYFFCRKKSSSCQSMRRLQ